MRVTEIWRYPVKSLQGEMLDSAQLGPEGVAGDRGYALFDAQTGEGLTARRLPAMLFASARAVTGSVEITLPDGSIAVDDAALSSWLGRPVALRSVAEVALAERPLGEWDAFDGSGGSFRDTGHAAVSLVSIETLGQWDRRRFRPNIVLDSGGEEELVGREVRVGHATLELTERLGRCVMVTRPQPGSRGPELAKDLGVLRAVNRERGGMLAVGALITESGTVSVGDVLIG